jgi:hypothetical protein
MFPSGENGIGVTLAGAPPIRARARRPKRSTVVYGEEGNSASAKRLEKGLVLEGTGCFPGGPGWVPVEQRLRLSRVPRIPHVSLPVGFLA